MATPKPIWRGHLRVALVSCPVALFGVVRASSGLLFHLISSKTGHRIRMVSQDAETDDEVARSDLVKGYEFETGRYVLLDEDDFEQARIDSSSSMTIEKFVDIVSIDPIFFDTSYFVAPDGDDGIDVFVVLRNAIRKARTAGLSRVVIARRDRAIAIIPSGSGLVCHTLHEPNELSDAASLYQEIEDIRPEPDTVALATQLINRQSGKFRSSDIQDRYEAKLRQVIDAKLRGEGITPEQLSNPDNGNVIDLMAALKAGLGHATPTAAKKRARKRAS